MLVLHAVLIGLAAAAPHYTHTARLLWLIGATLMPMPIYAAKTRGGWKLALGQELSRSRGLAPYVRICPVRSRLVAR
jgi:hypothetical protein